MASYGFPNLSTRIAVDEGGLRLNEGLMRLEGEQVDDTPMQEHLRQPSEESEVIEKEFSLHVLHHTPCTFAWCI